MSNAEPFPFSLTVAPIDAASANHIIGWQYPVPYDIYNLSNPDPRLVQSAASYLLEPANQFFVMRLDDGALAAFCSFGHDAQVPGGDYRLEAMDIGMGVHPELTGRGWGHIFAETAVAFAQRTYHPPRARVTIATFNQRAQKVWRKIGFTPTVTFHSLYDNRPFIIMVKSLTTD